MKVFEFDKIPIVEIVNEILLDGVKKGASDIHFDPSKEFITIRMRVDGVLHDYSTVPMEFKRNMISRVKMIASMNIMETRLPQDGAIKSKIGDKMLDLRVSSLPTNCGEKVVLRILDYSKSLQGLETLGFSEENLNKIFKMVAVPNGIVLVTGATGSGKSTTVYSILQRLNTREVNIITVEDPVEMDIEGLNQVQAQQEIGLDFANVLRSILRQDPDIIMIGEIRDTETAQIAVRASITGHKVLSTIHTNSALTTIERLIDMGVERYLIGTSLSGIISQKLARKLCPNCKIEREASDYEKKLVHDVLHQDIEKVYDVNPDGCDKCTRGYKNRVAIAEVLFINDEVRTGITNSVDKETMRKLVYGHGNTHTLLQDGLDKVVEGETSFDEILKLSDLENDLAITKELEENGMNDFSAGEQFRTKPSNFDKKPGDEKPTEATSETKDETSTVAAAGAAVAAVAATSETPSEAPTVPEVQTTPEVVTEAPTEAKVEVITEAPTEAKVEIITEAPTTPAVTETPTEMKLEILETATEVKTEAAIVNPLPALEVPTVPALEILETTVSTQPQQVAQQPVAQPATQPEVVTQPAATATQAVAPAATTPSTTEHSMQQIIINPGKTDNAFTIPTNTGAENPSDALVMPSKDDNPSGLLFEQPIVEKEKVVLSAVIPPNNTAAAVNLNTGEIPKNLEMFQ